MFFCWRSRTLCSLKVLYFHFCQSRNWLIRYSVLLTLAIYLHFSLLVPVEGSWAGVGWRWGRIQTLTKLVLLTFFIFGGKWKPPVPLRMPGKKGNSDIRVWWILIPPSWVWEGSRPWINSSTVSSGTVSPPSPICEPHCQKPIFWPAIPTSQPHRCVCARTCACACSFSRWERAHGAWEFRWGWHAKRDWLSDATFCTCASDPSIMGTPEAAGRQLDIHSLKCRQGPLRKADVGKDLE